MIRKAGIKNNTFKIKKPAVMNNVDDATNGKVRYKTLIINYEKYRTTFTRKFEQRKVWVEPDEKKIISVMPCTIIKLFVKEGQQVNKNNEMVLLEAMKMQNTLYFPFSGKIKKLNIKEGDKIPKGFIMAEYD